MEELVGAVFELLGGVAEAAGTVVAEAAQAVVEIVTEAAVEDGVELAGDAVGNGEPKKPDEQAPPT